MKKILLLLFVSIFLVSCFWKVSKEDENKAKKDLLSNDMSYVENKKIEEEKKSEYKEEKISKNFIESRYLTEEKFIEIDEFSISDFLDLEQEITWKTLTNVDKIIVNFSNSSSNFPSDRFQLKKFKAWDEKFLYRAFKKYETFDYGENIYVIEAYSWEKISKLEYRIRLEKEEKKSEPIEILDLPTSSIYWNPIEIWDWKITYSDVKWLEIEKVWELYLENNSDSITKFLASKYNWYFYWNTKRQFLWEKWLSFFVVRAEKEKYFYEKHYYIDWFYWILSLEEWDFDSENSEKIKKLWELNLLLKEKNKDFKMIEIADLLFQSFKK